MKPIAALFLAALVIGPIAATAYYTGWRIAAFRQDGKEVMDRRSYSTLDYAQMTFNLSADPPRYSVTLTDPRKVLFSRKALHADLCSRLITGEHITLREPPFTQFALFGVLSRRGPITIDIDRSKNELNPFMLLSVMSNQTDSNLDPFTVQRGRVREAVILHPDDSCTPPTK